MISISFSEEKSSLTRYREKAIEVPGPLLVTTLPHSTTSSSIGLPSHKNFALMSGSSNWSRAEGWQVAAYMSVKSPPMASTTTGEAQIAATSFFSAILC